MNVSAEETRVAVPRETLTEESPVLVALGVLLRYGIDECGAWADVANFTRGVESQPLTFSLTLPDESAAVKMRARVEAFRRDHGVNLEPSLEGCTVYFTVPADIIGKHGRHTTYGNNGCRGELCKLAKARRVLVQKERRLEKLAQAGGVCDPRVWPHGTATGYNNHKCRGEACQAAWASEAQARRHMESKQREQLAAADR